MSSPAHFMRRARANQRERDEAHTSLVHLSGLALVYLVKLVLDRCKDNPEADDVDVRRELWSYAGRCTDCGEYVICELIRTYRSESVRNCHVTRFNATFMTAMWAQCSESEWLVLLRATRKGRSKFGGFDDPAPKFPCGKCGMVRPLRDFPKRFNRMSVVRSVCKACMRRNTASIAEIKQVSRGFWPVTGGALTVDSQLTSCPARRTSLTLSSPPSAACAPTAATPASLCGDSTPRTGPAGTSRPPS